ncbi:hypothetical protein FCL54_13335 [Pseudalkalibacillus caeni]|uniref:NodB homology domain-containing protein n=1 Tax=Exobacillus caeni TaxID=2574798 RepID=A0A5R9F8T2_9BACL|nr:polysaccharide deacetylase family protein [Pseudalkalibacillus caeni]TLS36934.1 hypothetical protein FCL54_13335 [Pseudalkalibacillus caeni]
MATFFLSGNELEQNFEEGKAVAEAGHQIGNHTYSHQRMIFKKTSFINEEVEKRNELIRETGYEGEIDFRPLNGKKIKALPYYLNKQKIDMIMWSLETFSYCTRCPMTQGRTENNRAVLQSLSERGYRFVIVNELQEE